MTASLEATSDARAAFLAATEAGDTYRAMNAARELLRDGRKGGGAGGAAGAGGDLSFLSRELRTAVSWSPALVPLKIALLSSFSIEFVEPALVVHGFLNGLAIDIHRAGFGQFRQEILDPASGMYAFEPDVVILAVEGADWAPALYQQFGDQTDAALDAAVRQTCDEARGLVQALRGRSTATVLMHNFAPPLWRQQGIRDGQTGRGRSQAQWVHHLNESLAGVCREAPGVYVVDYAGLVARFGAASWYDERMRLYARAPVAADKWGHVAVEYLKYCRALRGLSKKCLVVDLDNTLWGGVLGEDGPHGIRLGADYPGNAYVAFQRALLDLRRRGVLLAVASKNNSADVDEVFAQNGSMVLKREHFSSLQIHWGPKSDSLRAIALQLNLGLDHLVFVDDNPVECEAVAAALPMVRVICLPKQPEAFVPALLDEGLFDTLALTAEDERRGELYRQRDEAEALRAASGSLGEFYRSLDMEVTIAPVTAKTLARAAQLTQKTNQFNVTTHRYTEAELTARMREREWLLATVAVRDRFGDNGIVGLVMAQARDGALAIDTLLMSCRVIGRTVETAMLAFLCEEAGRRGLREIRGRIVPTAKNVPVRQLFADHGFAQLTAGAEGAEGGETSWSLSLAGSGVTWPEWMKVRVIDGADPTR
jgi:FkbH-like protein